MDTAAIMLMWPSSFDDKFRSALNEICLQSAHWRQRRRPLKMLTKTDKGRRMPGYNMSLVTRKPVFGVSDQVRIKPACSATETN